MQQTAINASDEQLLAEYARSASPAAMEELVRRHIGWVYAAARREVRDPTLAEGVVQSVFLILMKKAATLRPSSRLSGWLFNACRYSSANALRMERRRRRHERQAAERDAAEQAASLRSAQVCRADELDVEQVREFLNGALARLGGADREAILIRYLQSGTITDVAHALGTTEAAARARVSRALAKLRQIFKRRGGDTLTESTLVAAAALPAVHGAARESTAAAVLRTVSTPALRSPRSLAIAKGAVHMWTIAQLKSAAAVVITVLAVIGIAAAAAVVSNRVDGTAATAPADADVPNFSDVVKGKILRQLPITRDTMALAYLPDWAHGDVDNIGIANNDGGVRTLIDWSPIAAADMAGAQTKVYLALNSRKTTRHDPAGRIGAFEILQPWDETGSPWTKLPQTAKDPAATFDFWPGEGWKTFDITELVRAQITAKRQPHGVMLRFLEENKATGVAGDWSGYQIASREADGTSKSLRPVLLIVDESGQ
jgi:RNA polymerase sigma factor (sigma-70 family)